MVEWTLRACNPKDGGCATQALLPVACEAGGCTWAKKVDPPDAG